MEKLYVDLKENSYDIFFESSFDRLPECMEGIKAPKKIMIISDSNVSELYSEQVKNVLEKSGYDISIHVFPAGEENKKIEAVMDMCRACMENGLDRKSMIIALGGGVTGDMAGFAASIYMRGIPFVQIPTTLLSQSDSSVGGKTGVDFCGGKNIIGAFHQPKMVYINVSTLKTLPEKEFISGMGEVIKHGVIRDKAFFEYVEKNAVKIKSLDENTLIKLSEINCKIKADVVSKDEKESGLRRILNFGHTIGHAVESAFDFTKTHGQCVAFGMICVFKIAFDRGLIEEDELIRFVNVLNAYGFETSASLSDKEKIIGLVHKDKKKDGDKVSFILSDEIGSVKIVDDVSDEEIRRSLEYIEENKR